MTYLDDFEIEEIVGGVALIEYTQLAAIIQTLEPGDIGAFLKATLTA